MRTRCSEDTSSSEQPDDGRTTSTAGAHQFTPDSIEPPASFVIRSNTTSNNSGSDLRNNNNISSSSAALNNPEQYRSDSSKNNNSSEPQQSSTPLPSSVNSTFYSNSSTLQTSLLTGSSDSANINQTFKQSEPDSPANADNKNAGLSVGCEQNNNGEVSIGLQLNRDEIEKRINIVSNLNVTANTVNVIMHSDSEVGSLATLSDDNKAISNTSNNNNICSNIDNNIGNNNKSRDNVSTSFYLRPRDDVRVTPEHSRLIKYMISNIKTGSIYTRPFGEAPLVVPRYSAVPRTTSMEVNASSPDSTDKESDSASLVDSLDEYQSPRQSAISSRLNYDDKPVRGDLSALLPDNNIVNGETPTSRPKIRKPAAFYVPILSEDSIDKDVKTVSGRMPDKVRDRLDRRKQTIDQRKHKAIGFPYHDPFKDNNGNKGLIATTNQLRLRSENVSNFNIKRKHRSEDKSKAIALKELNKVPDINSNTFPIRKPRKYNRINRRKHTNDDENDYISTSLYHSSTSLTRTPGDNKLFERPNYESSQQDLQKIEILEITEQTSTGEVFYHNVRSKIPVPVHNKTNESIKIPTRRSLYHPYGLNQLPEDDPKVDQLIANLLIDTLNKADEEVTIKIPKQPEETEKKRNCITTSKQNSNWYKHKFEMIPEEKSLSIGSPNESINVHENSDLSENENNNTIKSACVEAQDEAQELKNNEKGKLELIDASSQTDVDSAVTSDTKNYNISDFNDTEAPLSKGKAALNKTQNGDAASIPKGWVTFYMLRKNPGSSNSSDEGT